MFLGNLTGTWSWCLLLCRVALDTRRAIIVTRIGRWDVPCVSLLPLKTQSFSSRSSHEINWLS